jgi:hypothetical protein
MAYANRTWSQEFPNPQENTQHVWFDDLSRLLDGVAPTSHQITSTLSLLSASVSQGSALPPYMQLPEPFQLSKRLEKLDKGILDSRHVQEPGYSAYAVLQVASTLIRDDIEKLVENVKDLVGEVYFNFEDALDLSNLSNPEMKDQAVKEVKRD